MSSSSPIVVWFRQDLRLRDNPALLAAHEAKRPIVPVYILDDINSGQWKMGGASRWWLHHSLLALNNSMRKHLVCEKGDPLKILLNILNNTGADTIFWNRCYEPWRIQRDKNIKQQLRQNNFVAKSFNGALLFEPHTVLKADGTPYRVFTPFYRKGCLSRNHEPREPSPKPKRLKLFKYEGTDLADLDLLPNLDWHAQIQKEWQPGEDGALKTFQMFLDNGLSGYKDGRNYPTRTNVSRLSPYLHFGEISANDVWHGIKEAMAINQSETDGEHFLSEMGWREFSNTLLYHFPDMPRKNLQSKFDTFAWHTDDYLLSAWQRGQTGYPIVDAGMLELWQTGYMHNRVRMIVGSFLVKNLLIHWHHGEDWFWDTLVDADLANNSASWQWIAGCGADAAPYFRVFNPVTQGQKFDQSGEYVRRFLPKLRNLPEKYIHNPWEAPDHILSNAGVTLGEDYQFPIVDLKTSRETALLEYKRMS